MIIKDYLKSEVPSVAQDFTVDFGERTANKIAHAKYRIRSYIDNAFVEQISPYVSFERYDDPTRDFVEEVRDHVLKYIWTSADLFTNQIENVLPQHLYPDYYL